MGYARSIARSIERPISRSIARSVARHDIDAQAYFTAVEAAGGSFDLTGINATYTESYIKTAHSNFYAGLKTDGVWDKLTEFYLLAGKTFGGLTVKGKGTGTLTNNNFVTGDYLGVGSGAGLTGDGATKYLDTGLNDNTLSADDRGYSVYVTKALTVPSYLMLNYPGSGSTYSGFGSFDGVTTKFFLPASDASLNSPAGDGMLIGSRRGVNDTEGYRNGVSVGTDTSTASNVTTGVTFDLFANGGGAGRSDATLTFAHIGTGLTDTDASNLSTRVNTLMTALGCNTY